VTPLVTTTPGRSRPSTTVSDCRINSDLQKPDPPRLPQTKSMCMACRRSGVRIPLAPRSSRSRDGPREPKRELPRSRPSGRVGRRHGGSAPTGWVRPLRPDCLAWSGAEEANRANDGVPVGLRPGGGMAGTPVIAEQDLVADHGQHVLDLGDRGLDVLARGLGVLVADTDPFTTPLPRRPRPCPALRLNSAPGPGSRSGTCRGRGAR
jgi:hypothetical protein